MSELLTPEVIVRTRCDSGHPLTLTIVDDQPPDEIQVPARCSNPACRAHVALPAGWRGGLRPEWRDLPLRRIR